MVSLLKLNDREVIGKITPLYPPAIIEAHRDGVPTVSHRKRIGKFPRRYIARGDVIALAAEGRAGEPL